MAARRDLRSSALLAAISVGTLAVLLLPGASTAHVAPIVPTGHGPARAPGPSPRWGAQMVYDAGDGYTVLFGGGSGTTTFTDTWTYKAGTWTHLTLTVHPPAAAPMTYDAADGYVLMYGGIGTASTVYSGTWAFSGGLWHHINTTRSPGARFGDGIAYDVADRYVVLFGGDNGKSTLLGDTWKYVHGVWTNLSPASSPAPRRSGGMTYDYADSEVVLFGGLTSTVGDANDTWTYATGVWTQLNLTVVPGVRVAPSLTFDAADHSVLLFGGRDDNSASVWDDTWSFAHGVWTLRHPTGTIPSGRQGAAMKYDGSDGYVLLFGGATDTSSPPTVTGGTFTFVHGLWR